MFSQDKLRCGGRYYYTGTVISRDENKYTRYQNYSEGKFKQYGGSAAQGKYLFSKCKGSSAHQQSKLEPLASLRILHTVIKRLFTKEVSNVRLAMRYTVFNKCEQIAHYQELLLMRKGYQIPFLNLLIQEKPPNL